MPELNDILEEFENAIRNTGWNKQRECDVLMKWFKKALTSAVDGEKDKYRQTNIKELVSQMEKDAEEYGDRHDELCPCNMEYPDECDCENMKWAKVFAQEWMGKVNQMWVTNLYEHRKHCSPEGNKQLTATKNRLLSQLTKE